MKKLILLHLLTGALFLVGNAQVNSLLSMEEFNRSFYNPATIGQSEYIQANIVSRHQWISMPDAPSTQFVAVSSYIDRYNSGLGLSLITDRLGAESNLDIKLKYSYHAWFNKNSYISFGMGAGVFNRSFNSTGLIIDNISDPYQYASDYNKSYFDMDFGIEYTYKRFKIGVSGNHITNVYTNYKELRVPMHNYLYAKYKASLNKDLALTSGASVSLSGKDYQTSIFSSLSIKEKIHAGISYRIDESLILMSQIQITDYFLLGYAYDIGIGSIRKYNSGSHEIMLIGRFKKSGKPKSYQSPRFFD